MSLLIAEKGEGFRVAGKLKKMGYRAIDTCELVFEDYRVPVENLLGGPAAARHVYEPEPAGRSALAVGRRL